MNTPAPVVRLKNAWRSSHPWIFQKLVEKPAVRPKPGAIVDVVGVDGEWIGRGFYNGHSRIAVRILETDQAIPVDAGWFSRKIAQAVSLRREVLKLDQVSDAWRVVHSEGDGLSGLVVDRYGDLVVVEFFAAGMFRHREWVYEALREQFPGCRFHSFADEHVQKQESFDFHGNTTTEASVITEYGIKFRADPAGAHKTGFFADQRENREWLSQQVEGDLPIKHLRFQWAHIQQLGGLPGQFADGFTPLGRHCQVGGDAHALDIQQAPQWRQDDCQVGRRWTWAAELEGSFQAVEHMGIGFRHHLRCLFDRQRARQVDHRAAHRRGTRRKTQGHRRPRRKECQLDFAEVELIDLPHPHVLAAKRHRCTGRVTARQQVQGAHREAQFF